MSKKARTPKLLAAPLYYYYVTYQYDGGFGASALTLHWPINNWERIQILSQMIRKNQGIKKTIVLTNWILL